MEYINQMGEDISNEYTNLVMAFANSMTKMVMSKKPVKSEQFKELLEAINAVGRKIEKPTIAESTSVDGLA